MDSDQPIIPIRGEQACRFRDFFQVTGYTEANLSGNYGTSIPPPSHHDQIVDLRSRAEAVTPLNELVKLFFFGNSTDRGDFGTVLPEWLLTICIEHKLLSVIEETLYPRILLVPVNDLLLASDLHDAVRRDDHCFVPTISEPALHLSKLAVRRPVAKSLDLCCGFGLHALLASRFSDSVVATDLNPRSVQFVEFNAALNGCENVRAVYGDLFAGVGQERFDLILSNPPFVITPDAENTYRNTVCELDGFMTRLLADAPDHLVDGGVMQLICEWIELHGEDWLTRLRDWTLNHGCDVWVLHANRQLPSSYARCRLRESLAGTNELDSELARWEAYFEQRNVKAIHGGFIFLRRRRGNNWFDVSELNRAIERPIGDAIVQGFGCRDVAFGGEDNELLLNNQLHIVHGLKREFCSCWRGDGWVIDSITLKLEHGLPIAVGIDQHVSDLIDLFDGRRTVRDILATFADMKALAPETAYQHGITMIKMLVTSGLVTPRQAVQERA